MYDLLLFETCIISLFYTITGIFLVDLMLIDLSKNQCYEFIGICFQTYDIFM